MATLSNSESRTKVRRTVAIKTAQQYLESLKDGRVVYFDGELVPDVTAHPVCKITNDWVAMDYIMAGDPRYQDLLTDLDEDGERVSFALQPQKTPEDLFRLREVVKLWARVCFGTPTTRTLIADSPGTTMGRIVSRCGQIGVTTIAFTVGITIGPCADRL